MRNHGTMRQRQNTTGSTNTATYNENTQWTSFSANGSNGYDYKFINQNSSPSANYSVEKQQEYPYDVYFGGK